jgi:hypothetical protein
MRRLLFEANDRWKRLSNVQRLRAHGFWWEGVAAALRGVMWTSLLVALSLPLLWELQQERQETHRHEAAPVLMPEIQQERNAWRAGLLTVAVLCIAGQYLSLRRARELHEAADDAETLGAGVEEEAGEALSSASHISGKN